MITLMNQRLDGRAQQPGGSLTPRFFLPALLQSAYCNIATQQSITPQSFASADACRLPTPLPALPPPDDRYSIG